MKHSVGVIGAGTIGLSVALNFAICGINVVLIDTDDVVLNESKEKMMQDLKLLYLLKKIQLDYNEVISKVKFSKDYNLLEDVHFIIENVTEDWEIKREVYSKLEPFNRREVVIGVNTSCISITRIANLMPRPECIIGMHFMNPATLNHFVELVKGSTTSEDTINKAVQLIKDLNKKHIIINDSVGFISNRLSHVLMNEAAFLVYEGIATPSQIDSVFKFGYGHKMGPLETADLIGIDTVVNSLQVLYEHYQDQKFSCCPLLKKMIYEGALGKKNRKGFYTYEEY